MMVTCAGTPTAAEESSRARQPPTNGCTAGMGTITTVCPGLNTMSLASRDDRHAAKCCSDQLLTGGDLPAEGARLRPEDHVPRRRAGHAAMDSATTPDTSRVAAAAPATILRWLTGMDGQPCAIARTKKPVPSLSSLTASGPWSLISKNRQLSVTVALRAAVGQVRSAIGEYSVYTHLADSLATIA